MASAAVALAGVKNSTAGCRRCAWRLGGNGTAVFWRRIDSAENSLKEYGCFKRTKGSKITPLNESTYQKQSLQEKASYNE
jgi:hypothetical protein